MPVSTALAGTPTATPSPASLTARAAVTGQVGSRSVGSAQLRPSWSSVMSAQQSAAFGPQTSLLK